MLQPRIRRPEDFAGVLAEVGEDAGGFAEVAMEAGFVLFAVVAAVKDAEVAAVDGFFHQFAAEAGVGGAQHIGFFQAEVKPQRFHHRGGETVHAQMPQRRHNGLSFSRIQRPEEVVIVHHLPEAQAAFQVVVEHVGHAEDRVER